MKPSIFKVAIGLFLLTFMFSCGGREYANTKTNLEGAVGTFENKSSGEGNLIFHVNSVTDDFFDLEEEDALDVVDDKKFLRVDLTGNNTSGKMEINSLDFLLLNTKSQETFTTTIMAESKFDALEKYSKVGHLVFMVPKDVAVADFSLGMKFMFEDNGANPDHSTFIPLADGKKNPSPKQVTEINKSVTLSYFGTAEGVFTVKSMTENIPAGEYALAGEQLICLEASFENTSNKNFWFSSPYLQSDLLPKALTETTPEGEVELKTGSIEPGQKVSGKMFFETFLGDGNYQLLFSEGKTLEL